MMSKQTWINMALITAVVAFAGWADTSLGAQQEKAQDVSQWTASTHDGTNFPLKGRHRTVECRECHLNLVFEGTPVTCEACHWERRQDDRYQLRLGAHCGDCHTPHSWKNVAPNKWNHAAETGFPLEGIHRTLDCVDCHGDSGFVPGSVGCFDCHEEDYRETREPDHAAAGFPTQCQLCHRGSSRWEGAEFSHDLFALRGQHRQALCSDCHVDGKFSGLPTDCVSCHLRDFNTTEDPDHKHLGFPTDCEICHGTGARSWDNAEVSHGFFALRGEHKAALCSDCHIDGQFVGLSQECAACHLAEYRGMEDPDHEGAGFPLDCAICHGTRYRTWDGGEFEHDAFVLKGRHVLALCSDCHGDGVYAGRPSVCVSCHLADYNAAADPDHELLGFPMQCEACHGNSAQTWEGAAFDHDSIWPLQGAHTSLDCSQCHVSGTNLPRTCYGCHADDYNATTSPDHQLAGFPTDCELCHFPNHILWTQAVFDHQFPITSGKHGQLDCTECHLTANFKEFSCIDCHAHNQTNMNNKHKNVTGYVYASVNCYACHPDGQD